ncbi:phage tail tape measure protein [Enterobacter hormaechei subsp. xiangfangensis]|nr:phage tail tape measure protein [Enterobacter hormaechei]
MRDLILQLSKSSIYSTKSFNESQRALMDISQRTGTAFSDNASLFARSAASMREYGYSSEEVLKVTEAISTGLKLSGASTSEASSVITQFSQALAQGVLRGEEFNSVNENGDRVIRALASGMGVARKDLKAMADQGQLTADKVVPALISQLGALQDEYSAMPQTVASATTKIENAFLAWVGGANEATGATSALTGALNAISDNINTVASAAGVLAAIGGSRFIGGMIGDLGSQTAQLVEARKNEIALAAARASTATQSQRKAAADAIAAERAYQLARSELVLAKNTNAEATATQNAISKRRAMITANAALVQSNRAVAASQQALNSATSVLGLVKTGATGLLGLVGGLPGLLMLGAGAWYTMYQNQEQARRSAQEYAGQIDQIRQKTSQMSLTETDENRGQTVEALVEQNRLVDEQAKKVGELKNQIDDLNASRGKPGITSENDANILKAIAIVTDQLAVEEGKLNDMRDKSRGIQQALEEIERRRNDLIREQAWRQNAVYQSMIMMNGQHTEFNRLLGLGNQLLMARQGLANVPLRLPQADLDKKQTDALEKSRRDLKLSRLKGEAKERLRLSYAADDLGLTSDPQFQTGRQEFINNGLAEWRNNEANKPKAKGGKTEGEKTEDVYKRLIKQQKEQIALQGQNTELAKVKYQVSQGELASLTEAQKKTVLQNAALIDQVKLREQLRNYEANLADSNASTRAANEAQLLGYGQGTRFRERLQEQFNLRKEFEQKNTDLLRQRQAGEIDETFYQQGLALNKRYLEERLRDQEGYYAASDAQRDDWMTGLSEGYANWVDEATDYSSLAADGMKQAMGGAVTTITDMLNGNVDSWKDWGVSVLKIIQNVLVNMAVANGVSSIGSLFSFGASSAATASGGTAIQNAGANFTFNAKGNVYDSPSLSAYSNGVFQTPQLFAFAKGVGIFGEAGPEAIMPLTRAPNGDLAVRAVGMPQVSGGVPSVNFGDINIQGGSPQASSQGTAGAAGRQLKDAITGVINEQASMPGSPLWRLIKGV